jgi:hypothetical protein
LNRALVFCFVHQLLGAEPKHPEAFEQRGTRTTYTIDRPPTSKPGQVEQELVFDRLETDFDL